MNKKKKVGILGYGEVGKAIGSFYSAPFVQDIAGGNFPEGLQLDVLHICIPFKGQHDFDIAAKFAIEKWGKAALVFVHSTVAVGTTARISAYHAHVVHAPIRGVHPDLAEGIRTFPMFVGADSSGAGRLAAEHLTELEIEPIVLHKTAASELLKLLDTTYYGLCIAYHDYAFELCEKEKVNFEMVMTEANRTYNNGYERLGKFNVVRPVLNPPHGHIGGHCVIPNTEILRGQFGSDPLLEAILRHK